MTDLQAVVAELRKEIMAELKAELANGTTVKAKKAKPKVQATVVITENTGADRKQYGRFRLAKTLPNGVVRKAMTLNTEDAIRVSDFVTAAIASDEEEAAEES